MKRYNIVLFTLIVCACSVQAQTVEPITYKQYMHKVSADNLEYAAEKMNVSAAHADVIAAKVFDDPSLSFTYSNNEDHTLQMGQSYATVPLCWNHSYRYAVSSGGRTEKAGTGICAERID